MMESSSTFTIFLALKLKRMESSSTFTIFLALLLFSSAQSTSNNSNLFRAYIGAEFLDVKFSDLPINPSVEFHFILAFAIDYTNLSTPSPTNGIFNIFWDTNNLTPDDVINIKKKHPNVKVALSLGGDSVGENTSAYFAPSSVSSWVDNAVSSLTSIIEEYHLDGVDIDYEHFFENSEGIFVNCIGKLISTLKAKGVVSFVSIAPYDDDGLVESHYTALWREHGKEMIDYVNFQFYAYEKGRNVSRFVEYFEEQRRVYEGGRILVSYISDGSVGIEPGKGFFRFGKRLKKMGRLYGIFVWCADESKRLRFKYEKKAQRMLAN